MSLLAEAAGYGLTPNAPMLEGICGFQAEISFLSMPEPWYIGIHRVCNR